jgi:uncharacterized protein YkwD
MRALSSIKKRAAILVAVAAIGVGASACFADTQAGPPTDPLRAQVWDLMNQDRARNGLPGLVQSPKLEFLAQGWAQYMATVVGFTHRNLTDVLYTNPSYANYYTLGENILVGPVGMTGPQMESAWMNSAPHRANILGRQFNVVGIGYFDGPDGRRWICVDFGGI